MKRLLAFLLLALPIAAQKAEFSGTVNMAGATLTFVFPFLLYVFLQKQFVEGVAMGGVKG